MASTNSMIELFHRELELCGVGPGEKVAVLSEGGQLRDYASAFLTAARDLGADVEDVNVRSEFALSANLHLSHFSNSRTSMESAVSLTTRGSTQST